MYSVAGINLYGKPMQDSVPTAFLNMASVYLQYQGVENISGISQTNQPAMSAVGLGDYLNYDELFAQSFQYSKTVKLFMY